MERERGPGLADALVVWALFAVVAVEIVVTYARLPAVELYHTSGGGLEAGLSRALIFLGYPFSIAAIALAAIAAARLGTRWATAAALAAGVLCATIGLPGVIDQSDLDARPVNAFAGVGVALALGLTVVALARKGLGAVRPLGGADALRAVVVLLLLLAAIPWLFAELGFYVSDVAVLGRIFIAKEIRPLPGGEPSLHAVHLGEHHGMNGVLVAISALVLSRVPRQMPSRRGRLALTAYLSLMLVYGLANALQDFWTEQLVKRGTLSARIPSLIRPDISWSWAAILLCAFLICLAAWRVVRVDQRQGGAG
jgi:hypothetical protein